MRDGRRTTLAAAALAITVILPAAASAHPQHPYDWSHSNPPAWWVETLGSGQLTDPPGGRPEPCTSNEVYGEDEITGGEIRNYRLVWGPRGNWSGISDQADCYREWDANADDFPDYWTQCTGLVDHVHANGTFENYFTLGAEFHCRVVSPTTPPEGICHRTKMASYDVGFFYNGPGPLSDTGWVPRDCRAELPGWPNQPKDARLCGAAQKKIKKATRRLRRANSAQEKRKARKQRRKAKRSARENCPVSSDTGT